VQEEMVKEGALWILLDIAWRSFSPVLRLGLAQEFRQDRKCPSFMQHFYISLRSRIKDVYPFAFEKALFEAAPGMTGSLNRDFVILRCFAVPDRTARSSHLGKFDAFAGWFLGSNRRHVPFIVRPADLCEPFDPATWRAAIEC
jgi:hypothetical protein